MPRISLRVAPKFMLIVAVLIPALAGTAWIGVHGFGVLTGQVNSLYGDHLYQAEQSAQLSRDLGGAGQVAQRDITATVRATHEGLDAQLAFTHEPRVSADLAHQQALHAGDVYYERHQVQRLISDWHQFLGLKLNGQYDSGATGAQIARYDEQMAAQVAGLYAGMDQADAALLGAEHDQAEVARTAAIATQQHSQQLMLWVGTGCLLVVLAVVFWMIRNIVPRVKSYSAFAGRVADDDLSGRLEPQGSDELTALGVALNEIVDRRAALRSSTARQAEFAASMQLTENEEEAQELLRRHLERAVSHSKVAVLNRNNSDDRLEAATRLDHDPELATRLIDAKPRSCLAVRFAQAQEQGAELDPLVPCAVCGARPERSTCEPLIVSGQVIGSVLVSRVQPVDNADRQRIRESVAQASPVLGNLRNLALAERRAATDSLTGLPNKRAAEDNLKRMIAQASRNVSPMAVALLDLDHFKQINDLHGHPKGDELLAMVGACLRAEMRDSDFVARYGGEEFLILLPDTSLDGAIMFAEKIREAVGELAVPELDHAITASLGVTVFPDDANDAAVLIRHVDRALYAAKKGGRNRVEAFTRATALTVD